MFLLKNDNSQLYPIRFFNLLHNRPSDFFSSFFLPEVHRNLFRFYGMYSDVGSGGWVVSFFSDAFEMIFAAAGAAPPPKLAS